MALSCMHDIERLLSLDDDAQAPALIAHILAETAGAAGQAELARVLATMPAPRMEPRPIRSVAQFCFGMDNGGIERVMAVLSGIVLDAGRTSVVITEREVGEGCYEVRDEVVLERVPGIDWGDFESSWAARLSALRDVLKAHEVDAYVYQPWNFDYVLADLLLCHACGIRFVFPPHGAFDWALTLPQGPRRDFVLSARTALLSDAVVSGAQVSREFYSHLNHRSLCGLNAVPSDVIADRTRDLPAFGAGTTIMWSGRMSDEKRCDDVIRIFATVRASNPGARLLMVGTGTDDYMSHLRQLADECGVASAIEWVGYTADVMPWYHKADAYLLTSPCEGYCMALLEAQAAGLPCVMYALPYLPFSTSAGVASVEQRDVGAAACELGDILSSPERRDAMRAGALAFFDQTASFDFVGLWSGLFDDLEQPTTRMEPSCDLLMWETLFDALLMGEDGRDAHHERELAQQREQLSLQARDEVAQAEDKIRSSKTYRLGETLSKPARWLSGR